MASTADKSKKKTPAAGKAPAKAPAKPKAAPKPAGAEKELNAFETLTLAPIDTRLIDAAMLSADEIIWLDRYHARVAETLSPLLDDKTRKWLTAATRPLARG